jgi:hypothetical protein
MISPAPQNQPDPSSAPQAGEPVRVQAGAVVLDGRLSVPENARGIVILSRGSENSLENPLDAALAGALNEAGCATLLLNPLTDENAELDRETGFFRENANLLGQRLLGAMNWLREYRASSNFSIGLLGFGVGAAAALFAAASRPDLATAVVSAGGRYDLAEEWLPEVHAPLLALGGEQDDVSTQTALNGVAGGSHLEHVAGLETLSPDNEAFKQVAQLAGDWFGRYLRPIR